MGNRRRRLVPRSVGSRHHRVIIQHTRCTTGRTGPLVSRRDGSRIHRFRLLRDHPRALSPHSPGRLTGFLLIVRGFILPLFPIALAAAVSFLTLDAAPASAQATRLPFTSTFDTSNLSEWDGFRNNTGATVV